MTEVAAAAPDEIVELSAKLVTYPVSRYPVQHATTAFHLATVHLQCGRVDEALPLLANAYRTFGGLGMRLEQTKALMMHGVALREGGRGDLAAQTFTRAVEEFGALDQPGEQAAASYNLGMALHLQGDRDAAQMALVRAYDLFLEQGYLAQAGAAARERGVNLMTCGEVATAAVVLADAAELADRAGDLPGLGAAANALGLVRLALADPVAALAEFSRAVGAYPRSLRPAEHAMAKANLAVAHERTGNHARARLAARQALAISSADPPVRDQALQLLDRLSADTTRDLLTVLDEEPTQRWAPILREEVLRWCDASPPERLLAVRGFLDGMLVRLGTSYDLAEALIATILELPPAPYAEMVASVVQVVGDLGERQERVRSVMGSAMARFAMPQWQRLAASLNQAAAEAGLVEGWR